MTTQGPILHRRGILFGRTAAAAATAALFLSSRSLLASVAAQSFSSASAVASEGGEASVPDTVHAAITGDLPALEALAAASSSTNFTSLVRATDANGWSALHEACRAGQVEAARFLVEHGADANERTMGGTGPTPLGIARAFLLEDHPMVNYLVGIGAEDRKFEDHVVVGADGSMISDKDAEGVVWDVVLSSSSEPCLDTNRRCEEWAEAGICDSNKSYMLKNCRKSCGVCGKEEEAAEAVASGRTMIYTPPSLMKPCSDNHDRCAEWAGLGECDQNPKYMLKYCQNSCGVCRSHTVANSLCSDDHEKCSRWAEKGECTGNPKYMLKNCKKSCRVCDQDRRMHDVCLDEHEKCEMWAEEGECDNNPGYMLTSCAKSCMECAPDDLDMGEAQRLHLDDLVEETRTIVDGTESYIRDVVFGNRSKYSVEVRGECRNRHEDCSYWAAQGECDANPKYMKLHCAPACRTCELIDFNHRCPIPENATDVFGPGDLNAMFERIADDTDFASELGLDVTVLSRPAQGEADDDDQPWVVTMESFVSAEECERLIELGGKLGYERSQDVGKRKFDGTFEGDKNEFRTSENAWCSKECYDDPLARRVMERIAAVTGVPETNSEYLQLLRYEEGQFYRQHHDFIGHHVGRPVGPRILTLYLYLNDVEEGGGTDFPDLGLTVMPKRGMALLWPSVLDEDPNVKDTRTDHQALPVERGMKFGANAWLHLRDFKTPDSNDCS